MSSAGATREKVRGPARVLPCAPRGLRREQAAAYWGVSPTKWDELVTAEQAPKPRICDGMKLWDVRELDDAFDALPHDGQPPKGNPLDEL